MVRPIARCFQVIFWTQVGWGSEGGASDMRLLKTVIILCNIKDEKNMR
jgi:hypothetical protein